MNGEVWRAVCLDTLRSIERYVSSREFDEVIKIAIDKNIANLRKIFEEVE